MLSTLVIAAFVMAAMLTWWFAQPSGPLHILDHPTHRSLHDRPTPRSGGVALLSAAAASGVVGIHMVGSGMGLIWIAMGALIVGAISFADDLSHLSPVIRLLAQLIAAGLLLAGGHRLVSLTLPMVGWAWPTWVGALFTVFFVVWFTNLFNFMDGMDGFAGGMAVFGFSGYALLGAMAGVPLFTLLSLVLASAAAGFLVFNFPRARIFMGDAGASTLGFLAAAFGLWADRDGLFPLWIAVLMFSPFFVDATVTLLRRALRGEKVWEAHRSHFYQRLVLLGWSHRRTVLWEYGLMAACLVSAVLAVHGGATIQLAILGAWVLVYPALMAKVMRLEHARQLERQPGTIP